MVRVLYRSVLVGVEKGVPALGVRPLVFFEKTRILLVFEKVWSLGLASQ